ncbi:hypothetical protein QYM36_007273 [Artemia franciscana]|uniref:Uncharacterized protein n=1 Tax=Artemia franciscana TaxID=6661 RepID=A0AA88L502_ARTSF|nr:hypothetical protein QYM36_007273 [Artemia franciscana]
MKTFAITIPVSCVGIVVWWAIGKYSELKEELIYTIEEKQLSLVQILKENTEAAEKEKNLKESCNGLKEQLRRTIDEKELLTLQLLEEKKRLQKRRKTSKCRLKGSKKAKEDY